MIPRTAVGVLLISAALTTLAVSTPSSSTPRRVTEITATPLDGTTDAWSLPLIPHHTHASRRRELGLATASNNDRPHRYTRRQLDGDDNSEGDSEVPPAHQIGALYQGYGTHYVDLWIGTPPQRQTVIVDTGSGITAFPSSGCSNCGESYHTDHYFHESDSSTFHKMGCNECFKGHCSSYGKDGKECRISMSYQEGSSWSAYEGKDITYAGGPHDKALERVEAEQGQDEDEEGQVYAYNDVNPLHASLFSFNLVFGCQTSLTGLFKTQLADGIMGMDNAGASFWKQMHNSGVIKEKKFSLCFSRQPVATREGTEAGALTMGGVDTRLHRSPMVFAKNVRGSGFYTVHLKKVYLREGGGDSAKFDKKQKVHQLDISESQLNSGGVIVDSGTTDTYMNRKLATPFKSMYKKITGKDYSHSAVDMSLEEVQKLPTVLFQLSFMPGTEVDDPKSTTGVAGKLDKDNPQDIILAVPPTHYMEFDAQESKYVARLYLEEGSGSVLGANAMMGHDVLFDVEQSRIGFAESNCDYTWLMNTYGPWHPPPPGSGSGSGTEEESASSSFGEAIDDDDEVEESGTCDGKCKGLVVFGLFGAVLIGFVAYRNLNPGRHVPVAQEDTGDADFAPTEGPMEDVGHFRDSDQEDVPEPPPIT